MNTKIVSFLLLFFTPHLFSMHIQNREHINSTHIKQEAASFLECLLDKKLPQIKQDFHCLPQAAQYRALACSGNAQPIIMMAVCTYSDLQEEIASRLLDNDRRSAKLFCSLRIKDALYQYKKAEQQSLYYSKEHFGSYGFNVPVGFHFRTSDEVCVFLSRVIKSVDKKEPLTHTEMKTLYLLLHNDPWLTEKVGIKSQFLYQSITRKEKVTIMMESMQQVPLKTVYHLSFVGFALLNSAWATATPVLMLMGLVIHMTDDSSKFIKAMKDLSNDVLTLFIKPSALVTLTSAWTYILYRFMHNYFDNKRALLERKKTYL